MKAQLPLMSIGASGSFAGAIVAATWKGRPYLRQLVTPSNPKSVAQSAFRAMFKFLGQAWADLTDNQKASWTDLASQGNYTTFNAYMKYDQDRWGRALGPVVDPNQATAAGSDDTVGATAGVKSVSLVINDGDVAVGWGTVIYRKIGSAPTGIFTEVIAVIPWIRDTGVQYTDLKLTPGLVYHYKVKSFSISGDYGDLSGDTSATPTS